MVMRESAYLADSAIVASLSGANDFLGRFADGNKMHFLAALKSVQARLRRGLPYFDPATNTVRSPEQLRTQTAPLID